MRRSLACALALLLIGSSARPLLGQQGGPLQPPTTGGLTVLLQELQMLGHNKRVLMIGAHPDDEDTQLLVLLTRREGAEAAYLSLNRGEGGQNLIGPELGEALGILRTEELMAARNVDGAQQFFTRAYDFGFSKTLDDTWAHWPKDSVLKDVVRIVRRFRPQVIVSVFSGTPRAGHGQHQAAGWAAQEAYRAAADPNRFPELKTEEGLDPWTPTKLYIEAWFNPTAATLSVDGGEVEKLSGKTYHQLAMAARSLHRSQRRRARQRAGIAQRSPPHSRGPPPRSRPPAPRTMRRTYAGRDRSCLGFSAMRWPNARPSLPAISSRSPCSRATRVGSTCRGSVGPSA
ncbi:MAG: PIG-L family deacetylase [Gemmatimonadetes bacterium]|nr:PIG-L family deacetylase [Gemmatimonadota bacterium]